jgi:hypothetical protein
VEYYRFILNVFQIFLCGNFFGGRLPAGSGLDNACKAMQYLQLDLVLVRSAEIDQNVAWHRDRVYQRSRQTT